VDDLQASKKDGEQERRADLPQHKSEYQRRIRQKFQVHAAAGQTSGSGNLVRRQLSVGRKGKSTMLILIIILVLVLGGGGGFYGHSRWGYGGGAGIGLGTILLILLIAYLLGGFR
jgi:hypothetical protein